MVDKSANRQTIICLKGAEEIAEYVKENPQSIIDLVKNEELPAFKRNGKGPWRALNIDLDMWFLDQRRKYINNRKLDAEKNDVNT